MTVSCLRRSRDSQGDLRPQGVYQLRSSRRAAGQVVSGWSSSLMRGRRGHKPAAGWSPRCLRGADHHAYWSGRGPSATARVDPDGFLGIFPRAQRAPQQRLVKQSVLETSDLGLYAADSFKAVPPNPRPMRADRRPSQLAPQPADRELPRPAPYKERRSPSTGPAPGRQAPCTPLATPLRRQAVRRSGGQRRLTRRA